MKMPATQAAATNVVAGCMEPQAAPGVNHVVVATTAAAVGRATRAKRNCSTSQGLSWIGQ
jgi:hypothetical protein